MSRFHRLFSENSDKYARFRPVYPSELYQKLFSIVSPERELAVDLATGTGQAAVELAKIFTRVVAVDSSTEQITQASSSTSSLSFQVASAESFVEQTSILPKSVNLITVAQALHWFDRDLFYKQCQSALKPNGSLAAWGYGQWTYTNNPSATKALDELYNDALGPYWSLPIRHVENRYAEITPTEDLFHEVESFIIPHRLTLNMRHCIGYLSTWSAYRAYLRQKSAVGDPLEIFYEKSMEALQLRDPDQEFEVDLPFFGFVATGIKYER